MMDRQQAKDTIARCRFEIKRCREANRRMRSARAQLKNRPIGQGDPIQALKLLCSINERMAMIRDRERYIKEIRLTFL
jgi:hypothetical protein